MIIKTKHKRKSVKKIMILNNEMNDVKRVSIK